MLRSAAIRARRFLTRSKKKGDRSLIITRNREYKLAKRALHNAVKEAKNNAWGKLVAFIDHDPWGLPYKLVMGKFRKSSPSLSETLEEVEFNDLLDSLFPRHLISINQFPVPPLN